jgi:hypothetical protein
LVDQRVKDQLDNILANLELRNIENYDEGSQNQNHNQNQINNHINKENRENKEIKEIKEYSNTNSIKKKEAERIIDNLELEQLANNLNNTYISIRTNNPNDYEELLQKLEGDIRNHIKIQHQYRIYTDSLKHKIEELEKLNNEQKNLIANLNEVIILYLFYLFFKFLV